MTRFNTAAVGSKTTNLAGGTAYAESPELALASLLLTSFAQDQFYAKADEQLTRLKELLLVCDPKFAAQAIVYARHEFGMRSITHAAAAELAPRLSGLPWAKWFYRAVVHRPDDITEILSYQYAFKGKPSGAMKKGLALAFGLFSPYQLAKYRGEGKNMKLVDAVNILHPASSPRNENGIAELVTGTLRSQDTWESELTRAGQNATTPEEKAAAKADVWTRLISENKLGYFALLRNLRNIIEQAPAILPVALRQLTDDRLIAKSLVLPFRFLTAFDEVQKLPSSQEVRNTLVALTRAVDISLQNVPQFEGETLVVLDVSGSMTQTMNGRIPARIASLFAATLLKASNADLLTFSTGAQYVNYNPMDTTITLASSIPFQGGGTNFGAIFQVANKKYDRVILLSDMQGWKAQPNGWNVESSPVPTFNAYKQRTGANPKVFSFDLAGHGSVQFPEREICCLAGFSEKTLELLKLLEQDRNALVNKIKQVAF
ncbi:TROVE domain-containing protein [Hymenobacter glacieicola]|uniref:Ribonucleoprotein n=1 Tax=Hymenobacter glacieicola TaxID=1562124 RepID=A0ABQ1X940_9BACT|nr:TROVE domain-containing protein [Hymenobacter glacieicola]GGG61435.1 ribonucleoprotein [Hymenobacter glacieicola]